MGRALLVIAIVATALDSAVAQFGGIPEMPGAAPFGAPQGPPPKCLALLAIRDELQKHSQAISTANEKRADVSVACKLFRTYIATEAKMLRMLEEDGASCGMPAQILQQVRGSHAKAQQIGRQVCDAAWPRPRFDDRRRDGPEPLRMPHKMGGAA